MKVAVLIPAYQPGMELVRLIRHLVEGPLESIIVVDDGSGAEYHHVFEQCSSLPRVTLLHHRVNLGKGAALKTGMKHIVRNLPDFSGVVTADADGQHQAQDVLAVAERFSANADSIVLGSRQFEGQVPWKSRFGNTITRPLVRWLIGRDLTDTQTGLRAIPFRFLPVLSGIPSNGYEFELDMLIASKHHRIPVVEQPIKTIYQPGNPSSHFNPLVDSLKIYFVLLRFIGVSLVTAVIDNAVFILTFHATGHILSAQVAARTAATCFNYPAGRKAVFLSGGKHTTLLPRYLTLVLCLGSVSYFLTTILSSWLVHNVVLAKITGEGLLFTLSFAIQRDFVFSSPPAAPPQANPATQFIGQE